MAAEQLITACVFHLNAAQREIANRFLQESGAAPLSSGDDVTYAQLSREALAKLRAAGLEIEPVVNSITPSEPPAAPPPEQIKTAASAKLQFPVRRSKRTDPALRDRAAKLAQRASAATGGRQCYRVAVAGPLTSKIREQLKGLGVKPVNFRRGYYQAFLDPGSLEKLKQLEGVREVRPYDFLDTVTTDLLVRLEEHDREHQQVQSVAPQPSPSRTASRQIFDAIMHDAADLPAVLGRLQHLPEVQIMEKSDGIIRFSMPLDEESLARVASWPEVRSLGPYRAPTLLSDLMRRSLGVESVGIVPPAGGAPKRWTGLGEVIAILDSGIDLTHPDFGPVPGAPGSRIRAIVSFQGCDTDDTVGHGTHVAGIASGSGAASNNQIRGVAPEAELVIVGMVNDDGNGQRTLALPLEMEDLFREATSRGAKIINCSWAKKINSAYDTVALKIDEFAWRNPETLIVVAAGNEGAFSAEGERRYYTLGSPASAKNVLTVGACGSERTKLPNGYANTWAGYNARFTGEQGKRALCPALDEPAALTSCGPTDDLGVKPTLLAPGTFILAPRAKHIDGSIAYLDFPDHGSRYVFMHGTSMAAPGVSGAAAILRQFLREEMQTPKPSSALLRALLVSATQPVNRMTWAKAPDVGHPDFDQGFGRLDLTLLLPNPNASAARRILFDDVANDSPDALASDVAPGDPRKIFRKYEVDMNPQGTQELVFALAWTDPPGSGVMNDLQLAMQMPDGRWRYGNENHKPPDAALLPAADPAFPELVVSDRHNTVEKITIPNPAAGRYTIRVWARNTAQGPQGYSLAVVGDASGGLKRVV